MRSLLPRQTKFVDIFSQKYKRGFDHVQRLAEWLFPVIQFDSRLAPLASVSDLVTMNILGKYRIANGTSKKQAAYECAHSYISNSAYKQCNLA
jgi:hypothetical protein